MVIFEKSLEKSSLMQIDRWLIALSSELFLQMAGLHWIASTLKAKEYKYNLPAGKL